MRHANSWIAKAAALAVVALVGLAVMTATGGPGEPVTQSGPGGPAFCAANDGAGTDAAQAVLFSTREPDQQANLAQPAAICKLRPECWSDSDCDLRCGIGLGKCIHSKCPVRICVCR